MRNVIGYRVGLMGSFVLLFLAATAGCAQEAAPDDEVATAEEALATAPVRSRQDLITLMNSIEHNARQLDRLEGKLVDDFTALGAAAAKLDAAATALREAATSPPPDPAVKLASTTAVDPTALAAAVKQMQEVQLSFNLQYLLLQNQLQNENRIYTIVSNIMKTKHDTVKNSISNIR